MSQSVDVAVVGGGAIDCSVAYHAARRGARVVLLGAERLGSGSSLYESLLTEEAGMR